jgi:hypothetical protein
MTRKHLIVVCSTLALITTAGLLIAGPLNPPAGPITSTYKTLTEVEPRTAISGPIVIATDGSYYLTGNITVPAGGYAISGGQTGILIPVGSATGNIVIQNGTIRNTSGSGIFTSNANTPPTTVRNVRLENIADAGIYLLNAIVVVDNVSIAGKSGSTSSSGITAGSASRITNARIESVALRGIDDSAFSQIDRVVVAGAGTDGIRVGTSSSVSNSTVLGGTTGFNLNQYCTVISSTASNTSGIGFQLDAGGTVKDCNANNIGGDAYVLFFGGTVLDSVANAVLGDAFKSSVGGVTFDRCTASNINLNGFNISSGSVVTNSTVTLIGANSSFGGPISSGVIATGSGNRIEGNRFVSCGYPVFIASGSTSNSVYRNAAASCNIQFTNNGGATNQIGTIRTNTPAVGPWDNTFQ